MHFLIGINTLLGIIFIFLIMVGTNFCYESEIDSGDIILLKAGADPIPGRRVLWANNEEESDNFITHEYQDVEKKPCKDSKASPTVKVEYSSSIVENGKHLKQLILSKI